MGTLIRVLSLRNITVLHPLQRKHPVTYLFGFSFVTTKETRYIVGKGPSVACYLSQCIVGYIESTIGYSDPHLALREPHSGKPTN